jgi:hypothetical protein
VLTAFILGSACCLWAKQREVGMSLAALLFGAVGLATVQALCERPANFAPVLKPFVKRGRIGRLAGRLLYPGWHTGVFFGLLMSLAGAALLIVLFRIVEAEFGMRRSGVRESVIAPAISIFAGIYGCMILPVVIWRALGLMYRWNFWRWFMIFLCVGLFHGITMIIVSKTSASAARVNLILPSGGLMVPVIASVEVREEWREKELNNLRSERTATSGSSRLFYDWQERQRRENEITSQLFIFACISLAVWLSVAMAMAITEMRHTRRAEDELAAALAADVERLRVQSATEGTAVAE